jgi:two-component system, cell cycle response regulator
MVGKILIVDDVATNRIVQKVKLSAAFYQPILASDAVSCLAMARVERPDLILLEQFLPDMPNAEVLHRLAADPVTRSIPVIVMTSLPDPKARIAALAAGAQDVLSRPVHDQMLLARIRSLIRAHSKLEPVQETGAPLQMNEPLAAFDYPGKVALMMAGPYGGSAWHDMLRAELPGQVKVYFGAHELAAAISHADLLSVPDVFAVETGHDDNEAGLRILSELRSSPVARYSSVCLIRPDNDPEKAAFAFDMGADDVFPAAMAPTEIVRRIQRLVARKHEADLQRAAVEDRLRQAVLDPLTGLYNRRFALPQLTMIGQRASEEGTDFAAFVVDIDRFKGVNDRFGHTAGDAVLVEVAQRLTANLRTEDLLARIGGEEFLAVLPDITLAAATGIAERLCNAIAAEPFLLPDGTPIRVTVSIGMAISTAARADRIGGLIDDADHALMAAKSAGRNQVTLWRSAA